MQEKLAHFERLKSKSPREKVENVNKLMKMIRSQAKHAEDYKQRQDRDWRDWVREEAAQRDINNWNKRWAQQGSRTSPEGHQPRSERAKYAQWQAESDWARQDQERAWNDAQQAQHDLAREESAKARQLLSEHARSSRSSSSSSRRKIPWLAACEAYLANKIGRFPQPVQLCNDPSCRVRLNKPSHPLKACKHSVARYLEDNGKFSVKFLRSWRLRWHPDRFSVESAKPAQPATEELFKTLEGFLVDAQRQ